MAKESWVERQRLDRLSSYNSLVKERKTSRGEADRLVRPKNVCFEDGTPMWGAFNSLSFPREPTKKAESPKFAGGLLQWVEDGKAV